MVPRRTRIAESPRCAASTRGVLAFGAVYAWAYWPLAVACAGAGALGLSSSGRFRLAAGTRDVAARWRSSVQSAVDDFNVYIPGNAALSMTPCGVPLHEERYRSG